MLDPFSGPGRTGVAAAFAGRDDLAIELERKYRDHARRRLAGAARYRDGRAAA